MKASKSDIIILGAGLTGLTLAYLLKDKGLSVRIIEARERVGGRILTKYQSGKAPIELGATWLGLKHSALNKLLAELGIPTFVQELSSKAVYEPISTSPPQLVQLPRNDEPSYRICGGTSTLIDRLKSDLREETIVLGQLVRSIEFDDEGAKVLTRDQDFHGTKVISTLPPNLLFKTIGITPQLKEDVISIAKATHTWMGESIKVALTFKTPFWRKHSSGTIFSNVGPIPEMYDHSNVEDDLFALKGFFNGSYFSLTKEERRELVLLQLRKYYGNEINDFESYEEMVWRNEPNTFVNYDAHVLPHQNNGHPIYQNSFLEGSLYIAGAETASAFPGYMEGAVRSAYHVFDNLVADFNLSI